MNYTFVNGAQAVAKAINNYNIDYSDWIARSPEWISDAIAELKTPLTLIPCHRDIDVTNYTFTLPTDLSLISKVEYNGYRLDRCEVQDIHSSQDIIDKSSYKMELRMTYVLNEAKGVGFVFFETGTIRVYYKKLPVELDEASGLYFPMIPKNTIVVNAIATYLLYSTIRRGHKHPVYTLDSNNPFTNPGLMWNTEKKKAKNQFVSMDMDNYEQISRMLRTFIVNYNFRDDGDTYSPYLVKQ